MSIGSRLADALERALADGEHWHEFMPAARPPVGVRNLPAHAAPSGRLRTGSATAMRPIRAIVIVERLAAGGYGSALYEADQAWLGRELTRIRYELEACPDRAGPASRCLTELGVVPARGAGRGSRPASS